jgi:hypothetical protein
MSLRRWPYDRSSRRSLAPSRADFCGGGSKSPQAPTPTPKPTPPPPWSLPGHVIATLSGAPVAHATVNAFIATAESGTDGSFTLNTTPAPVGSQAVTVSAEGYRPRDTVIKWPRTEDLVIDLMSSAKPFDETLYSQLAHGTLEYPGKERRSAGLTSSSGRRMSSVASQRSVIDLIGRGFGSVFVTPPGSIEADIVKGSETSGTGRLGQCRARRSSRRL